MTHARFLLAPIQESVTTMPDSLTQTSSPQEHPFILDAVMEGHNPEYTQIDYVIIQSGVGKNAVQLDDREAYQEDFPPETIPALLPLLDGRQIEIYDIGREYHHPSVALSQATPQGLVSHMIGDFRNLRVETLPDRTVLRGTAFLNDSPLAHQAREAIRHAVDTGAQYIPAPSINGLMLWLPERTATGNFFRAMKPVSMRSVELVTRPAAGGVFLSALEAEQNPMDKLLAALKAYCQAHHIEYNAQAKTAQSLFDSISAKDTVLSGLNLANEDAALSALATAGVDMKAAVIEPSKPEMVTAELKSVDAPKIDTANLDAAVDKLSAAVADLTAANAATETPAAVDAAAEPLAEIQMEVQQAVKAVNGFAQRQAKTEDALTQIAAAMKDVVIPFVQNGQKQTVQDGMIKAVQEAVISQEGKNFFLKQVYAGRYSPDALTAALVDYADQEKTRVARVQESMKDLPVSVQHLAGINVLYDETEIPVNLVRAKQLFKLPLQEAEQKAVVQKGIRPFKTLQDMYHSIVPGDPEITGIPFGGSGANYRQWFARQLQEGISDTTAVVKNSDFNAIFLDVINQYALRQWQIRDLNWLRLCAEGPDFFTSLDENYTLHASAPDPSDYSADTGYADLSTGAMLKVTTSLWDKGGILRWSKWVWRNNTLDVVTQQLERQIDAIWRAAQRTTCDLILGWGGSTAQINGASMTDGLGVLYAEGGKRKNLVVGDGRQYAILVQLLGKMMSQEDYYKEGQDAQPLPLSPALVVAVNTAAVSLRGLFTQANKPGSDTEPNELGIAPTPEVVGVHRNFLRKQDNFVALLPNPAQYPVIQIQYYNGNRQPEIVWQNQPMVGRVFENDELAVRLDFALRIAMLNPKGIYAAWK